MYICCVEIINRMREYTQKDLKRFLFITHTHAIVSLIVVGLALVYSWSPIIMGLFVFNTLLRIYLLYRYDTVKRVAESRGMDFIEYINKERRGTL